MEAYLKGVLSLLGVGEPVRQIKGLMITVPKLSSAMVQVVYEAAAGMGFSRNQIFLQDYDESFYYYVMTFSAVHPLYHLPAYLIYIKRLLRYEYALCAACYT